MVRDTGTEEFVIILRILEPKDYKAPTVGVAANSIDLFLVSMLLMIRMITLS